MPVQKGKLKPGDEAKITAKYKYLLDELDSEDLVPALFAKEVIDRDDMNAIESKATRKEKIKVLIDKLFSAGSGEAYNNFIECLKESGYELVAEKLESTDSTPSPVIESQPSEQEMDWMNNIPDKVLDEVIVDASASKLAFQIGTGWEHLMLQLGVGNTLIEREKAKGAAGDGTTTVTNLLIRWRQKEGKAASWRHFFLVLKDLYEDDAISVELENVIKIACQQK
ncbi:uncharacterized protein LOC101855728 [Aplysia californica]|uniref:Uncharacterized protein LOC101855728 n=1 Tax=Aplysia californica TaxID=6500 RepID=A0ABM1VUB3_APLCA|nr:uncharacterized protein LOC101855728 [Aplysia californica]XP_035826004.1 uncharacterized protein LOC101855728 [Aplysia californica]XP_035826005.1 uncharacterized protein LOC101855728 [Aplysia californica]